jgi:DHA2 family multidrug resistance protein
VTDALGVVTWLTLAAGLPLLWVFRKKRKKTPAGNPGAAGEAGES